MAKKRGRKAKRKTTAEKRPATSWSKLLGAASKNCAEGTAASKKRLEKAAKAYKKDALAKGKEVAEVDESIKNVMKCKRKRRR